MDCVSEMILWGISELNFVLFAIIGLEITLRESSVVGDSLCFRNIEIVSLYKASYTFSKKWWVLLNLYKRMIQNE